MCSSLAGVYLAFLSVNTVHSQDVSSSLTLANGPHLLFPFPHSYHCERLLCAPSEIHLSHLQTTCHTHTPILQPLSLLCPEASLICNLALRLLDSEAFALPNPKHIIPLHKHPQLLSLSKESPACKRGQQGSYNRQRKIGRSLKRHLQDSHHLPLTLTMSSQ